jgi:AcrR family transcriptional regulator
MGAPANRPDPPRDPLDQRLVDTALRLLEEEGLEGVSLRRIARRAGVSHGAPLRHFHGLADLLAVVAARGFALLSEVIEKRAATLPPGAGPLARLNASGRAYVEAAVAHPALFALMFRPDMLDVANPHFVREAGGAFEAVVHRVRAAQDAGWQAHRDTRLLAGCVWAAMHGLATLWAQGAFSGPVPGVSLDDALETFLDLQLLSPDAPTGSPRPEPPRPPGDDA